MRWSSCNSKFVTWTSDIGVFCVKKISVFQVSGTIFLLIVEKLGRTEWINSDFVVCPSLLHAGRFNYQAVGETVSSLQKKGAGTSIVIEQNVRTPNFGG